MIKQLLQVTPRIALAVATLFYWFFVSHKINDVSVILKYIAIANILAILIPVGSNAHILHNHAKFLPRIIFIAIIATIFFLGLLPIAKNNSLTHLIFFTITNGLIIFIDRLLLVDAIGKSNISKYYLFAFFGRGITYIWIFFLSDIDQYFLVSAGELICRIPAIITTMANKKLKAIYLEKYQTGRPTSNLISTFSNTMIAVASWIPMSAAHATTSREDFLAGRMVIFLLGSASLLYLQEKIMAKIKKEKLGFVRSKEQLTLITISLIFSFILSLNDIQTIILEYVRNETVIRFLYTLSEFRIPILFAIAASYISWFGAWVYIWHNERKELFVAITCITAAVCTWLLNFSVPVATLLIGISWYLSVATFYRNGN